MNSEKREKVPDYKPRVRKTCGKKLKKAVKNFYVQSCCVEIWFEMLASRVLKTNCCAHPR
jgi:hypothetical protein